MVPGIQHNVLRKFNIRPKFIMLDTMNLWMDIMMDDLKAVISEIDCLTINDGEARQLSGEYSLKKAAKKILLMGPKYLIIKKGEHGALLFHKDDIFFCPALLLEDVFDPTGAGDTFAGGFIGYLAKTNDISFENMKKAILYGSAMASFCVEQFGTEAIQNLGEDQIQKRYEEFKSMTAL
jgi:sugar/nucleoside kinase (ribokinase family)